MRIYSNVNLNFMIMKRTYYCLLGFILISCLSLISCDNAIDSLCEQESSSVENLDIEVADTHSMLKFIYNGVLYTSEYRMEGDSTIILDEEVKRVADQMALLPELSAYVNGDGLMEYFNNSFVAESYLGNPIISATSRASMDGWYQIHGATATLYDDTDYRDRSFSFTIKESQRGDSIVVTQFKDKPYEFNDKASSLKIISDKTFIGNEYGAPFRRIGLILFEDDNFRGNSICFDVVNYVVPQGPIHVDNTVPSLKNFKLYPGSSRNWNDKVTSLKLKYLGRYGNY